MYFSVSHNRPYFLLHIICVVWKPRVGDTGLPLVGELTKHGETFWYISNKMQFYTVYLFMKTALHVSGGISTHHQEHIQLYLQHVALVKP